MYIRGDEKVNVNITEGKIAHLQKKPLLFEWNFLN